MDTLCADDKSNIIHKESKNVFKFGCGSKLSASECVIIPAMIGEKQVMIQTDVVEGDLPLLLSREFMKQANSNLDFRDDTLEILGQKLNLSVTNSGHYGLPLGRNKQVIGQDRQIVSVPHGGVYVKVHPCRLTLERDTVIGLKESPDTMMTSLEKDSVENETTVNSKPGRMKSRSVTFKEDSEDESNIINIHHIQDSSVQAELNLPAAPQFNAALDDGKKEDASIEVVDEEKPPDELNSEQANTTNIGSRKTKTWTTT